MEVLIATIKSQPQPNEIGWFPGYASYPYIKDKIAILEKTIFKALDKRP